MSALQKGSIYQHSGFGLVEFIRVDKFHGEHTLEFRQISTGRTKYLFPHEVEKMISDRKSEKPKSDDADTWESSATKEVSRAAELQAQVDELLAVVELAQVALFHCSEGGELQRKAHEAAIKVIKKITGEPK